MIMIIIITMIIILLSLQGNGYTFSLYPIVIVSSYMRLVILMYLTSDPKNDQYTHNQLVFTIWLRISGKRDVQGSTHCLTIIQTEKCCRFNT